MKNERELQKLIETVERQEIEAQDEMRHVLELARRLHMANSIPKTMSADGPTFATRVEQD